MKKLERIKKKISCVLSEPIPPDIAATLPDWKTINLSPTPTGDKGGMSKLNTHKNTQVQQPPLYLCNAGGDRG